MDTPRMLWPRLRLENGALTAVGDKAADALDALSADEVSLRYCNDNVILTIGKDPGYPFASCALSFMSVVELITIIVGGEHTGALDIQEENASRRLFFDKGSYVGGTSRYRADRLGEVLWREGVIGLDEFVVASQHVTAKKRLGRCLIELGFVDPGQLRAGLRRQAQALFVEACLMDSATAVFRFDEKHRNPVMLLKDADALVDDAMRVRARVEKLRVALGPADRTCVAVLPAPNLPLAVNEQAMLQLITSPNSTLTCEEVIAKSGLGTALGLEALVKLILDGFIEKAEPVEEEGPAAPKSDRLQRLIHGISYARTVMASTGFGVEAELDSFVKDPPEEVAKALRNLDLSEETLDVDDVRALAEANGVDENEMQRGLEVLLDFAVFEAGDYLPEAAGEELRARIKALDVIPL